MLSGNWLMFFGTRRAFLLAETFRIVSVTNESIRVVKKLCFYLFFEAYRTPEQGFDVIVTLLTKNQVKKWYINSTPAPQARFVH